MAHVLIAACVLAFHLFALAICILCRHWLRAVCDCLFLDYLPEFSDGEVDLQNLRKLWASPTDGMDLEVSFDSEGCFREMLRSTEAKRADRRF